MKLFKTKGKVTVHACLTDDGIHWPLCGCVRTKLAEYSWREIPQVRRLVGTTSVGTWHHTLGMSAISDDAAATSRLLSKVDALCNSYSSYVQATPSFCYCFTSRMLFDKGSQPASFTDVPCYITRSNHFKVSQCICNVPVKNHKGHRSQTRFWACFQQFCER